MSQTTWTEAYAKEFQRTNGFPVALEPRGGGWWIIRHLDTDYVHPHAFRRKQLVKMTDNLRQRPDYSPADEYDF